VDEFVADEFVVDFDGSFDGNMMMGIFDWYWTP
jgi:hypothetical protein